jgi:PIN domain nuclease of toxin-antitoxin system
MIIDTDVLIWYFKGNKNALNKEKKKKGGNP